MWSLHVCVGNTVYLLTCDDTCTCVSKYMCVYIIRVRTIFSMSSDSYDVTHVMLSRYLWLL